MGNGVEEEDVDDEDDEDVDAEANEDVDGEDDEDVDAEADGHVDDNVRHQTRKAHLARRQPGKKSIRGSTTYFDK